MVINLIDQKVTEFKLKCGKNPLADFLIYLFGEHELIDCQEWFHKDVGHPDYIVRKDCVDLYVEYKSPTDRIHTSQISWIFNNPDKKTIIIQMVE